MADPLSRLRGRFDRAIEWRVRAAIERSLTGEHADGGGVAGATGGGRAGRSSGADPAADRDRDEAIRSMRDDLATVSVQLTEQHRALAELVEQIDRRLTALERAEHDS